ncbi:recombinase RecA [Porcipelethomonas ammoniilytica]|jgi:recombination protein RecA|uniref:recombinase RecA n=1 Tax=Porcipelethomonas ammoniilytica TaxID=2981722 RepID=UPI0008220BFA|nr:recombinase RecA [Porcipelethomonas ammoniilytica]MBS6315410.1 recombinase RecA [Ruminococcus sp.]MCU6718687.1 recombinase RecA [Porcipelethomonas ammoniilytica]SCI58380.1 Recombinase A [uncultured Ruminococcus sp.]
MAKSDLKKKVKAIAVPVTKDEKKKALESAIAQIEKNFGKGAIIKLGANQTMKVDAIPTGSMGLDLALGIGGVPRGRIVELYGPESSGKTTVALHIIAEAQKQGGEVAFVDVEHALDPKYAAAVGVDVDNLLVSQPNSGEEALEIMEALVRSGAIDVVVLDSVAALTTKAEIDGNMGDSNVGQLARLMSQAMRKLTPLLSKTNCVAVFINQIREKIGVMYGNPETTPGGRALKFYSSVIIDVRKGEPIKNGTELIGNRTKIKVKKNKVAPPFKECEFDIIFGKGISRMGEVLDIAVELDIIKKSGSWFSYDGKKLGQGRDNVKKALEENPEMLKEIEQKVMENKDALEAAASTVSSKSKLEEAAENAAGTEDIDEIVGSMTDSFDDIDPVVNAEDDFEEFTPAE